MPFVKLISNVMENEDNNSLEDEKIIKTLLQHDDLIRTVVQMGFWDVHRPDIVKELKYEGLVSTDIVRASGILIEMLINGMEGESRIRLLKNIGTTPIVNKEYDSSCMVSYTAELVRGLKTEDQRDDTFQILQLLMREADCIDKDVVTEIIKLDTNAAFI